MVEAFHHLPRPSASGSGRGFYLWDWTVRDSMKRRSASEGMRTAAPILTKSIARAAISESIVRMLRDVAAAASFSARTQTFLK
jgi:hypothetical protein